MAGRRFNLPIKLLLVVCAGLLALWPVSYGTEPIGGVPLFGSVRGGAFEGSVWFANSAWPYHGSIIDIGRPNREVSHWPTTRGFDFAGVYFRQFVWPTGESWTLRVTIVLLLCPCFLLLALLLARSR